MKEMTHTVSVWLSTATFAVLSVVISIRIFREEVRIQLQRELNEHYQLADEYVLSIRKFEAQYGMSHIKFMEETRRLVDVATGHVTPNLPPAE